MSFDFLEELKLEENTPPPVQHNTGARGRPSLKLPDAYYEAAEKSVKTGMWFDLVAPDQKAARTVVLHLRKYLTAQDHGLRAVWDKKAEGPVRVKLQGQVEKKKAGEKPETRTVDWRADGEES